MGAIFGVTTCLSAQTLKNPEDPLNYFLGGCASGIILGARSKCLFLQNYQYNMTLNAD